MSKFFKNVVCLICFNIALAYDKALRFKNCDKFNKKMTVELKQYSLITILLPIGKGRILYMLFITILYIILYTINYQLK